MNKIHDISVLVKPHSLTICQDLEDHLKQITTSSISVPGCNWNKNGLCEDVASTVIY